MDPVTKPKVMGWEPANMGLWGRVVRLARGQLKELKHGSTTYYAPMDGAGLRSHATEWCIRVYNLIGGRWHGHGKETCLTDDMQRRVAVRHVTKLAKMLGEDIRKRMVSYRESQGRRSCSQCVYWVATTPVGTPVRSGRCLRHSFPARSCDSCSVLLTEQV